MKIKIKRATTEGLKENEGDFFETNGMQFCLVKADGLFFSIELSTGCNVKSFDTDDYSKKQAIELAKEEINRRTKAEWDYALNKVSEDYCSRFKFRLPVNEPVLNGL
jgi:hypothetical protein